MELRHLRYFVAVAEELHFGRAALRLHIAQPALSTQIQRLERELGVRLLQRTSRSVGLTAAGRVFLEEAYLSLDHSERAVQKARRAASGDLGRVRVGLVGSATYSVVTEVMGFFRKGFPDVSVAPHEMNTVPQLEALQAGELDVGFLRLPPNYAHDPLTVEYFAEEPLVAVLPAAHPLATSKRVKMTDLAGAPFVLADAGREPGMHELVAEACKDAGFVPEVAEETTELPVAMGLIATGVGVTLLPASVSNLQTNGISYRKLEEPSRSVSLSVAWNPASLSPAARTFLDFVRRFAQR